MSEEGEEGILGSVRKYYEQEEISRRSFLKMLGLGTGSLAVSPFASSLFKITDKPETSTINADEVDGLELLTDTLSNRPSAGTSGRLFYATDGEGVYYDNGSSWNQVSASATAFALDSNVTLNSQEVKVTVYEDTDGDGKAENAETVNVATGQNTYSLSKLEGKSGNEIWLDIFLDTTSLTSTPTVSSEGTNNPATDYSTIADWNYSYRTGVASDGTANTDHSDDTKLKKGADYTDINKGLVAYYPMERNQSTHLHDAALNNPGDINGATWTSGQVGSYALSFDGTDDYVDCGDIGDILPAVSVAAWVRVSDTGSNNVPFGKSASSDYQYRYQIQSDGDVNVRGYESGGSVSYEVVSTQTLDDGNWHHIAMILVDNDSLTAYVDGQSVGQDTTESGTLNTDGAGSFSIGERGDGYGYFGGEIDDVRIYDRALNPTEVKTLYNLTKTTGKKKTETPSPDPVAYYKLDGNAKDSAGSNDGTVNGATETSNAIKGTAYRFNDSNNDHVELPSDLNGTGNVFSSLSISAWVRSDVASPSYYAYVVRMATSSDGNLYLGHNNSGNWRWWSKNSSGTTKTIDTGIPVENQWTHLATSWNGSSVSMYINSDFVGDVDLADLGTNSNKNTISGNSNGFPFDGIIDQVRIYDRALTPLEVEKLYHYGSYRISREHLLNT